MKSSVIENRFFIECACGDPQHLLVFDWYRDDEDDEENFSDLSVYFVSNWNNSFWKRVKMAFKFIFIKEHFLWSDAVIIDERNIYQLETFIKTYKDKI